MKQILLIMKVQKNSHFSSNCTLILWMLTPDSSAQKLCDRLFKEFDSLTSRLSSKHGTVLHNKALASGTAIGQANFDKNSLKEAVFHLRKVIVSVNNSSKSLTLESLKDGLGDTPKDLLAFFRR